MVIGKWATEQAVGEGLKLGFKNNNNNNNRTDLFRLICWCNFIFWAFEDIIGPFSCVIWIFFVLFGLFCVIWLFIMCGECYNFELFGLFAVILIDLFPLIFFFFSKTKMRVGTLANPYFLNLYIPTNFFFFL
jgi:hypothetical protein